MGNGKSLTTFIMITRFLISIFYVGLSLFLQGQDSILTVQVENEILDLEEFRRISFEEVYMLSDEQKNVVVKERRMHIVLLEKEAKKIALLTRDAFLKEMKVFMRGKLVASPLLRTALDTGEVVVVFPDEDSFKKARNLLENGKGEGVCQ